MVQRDLLHGDILTPVYSAVTSEWTAGGRDPKRKEEVVFIWCYLCMSDSGSFWALLGLDTGELCHIRVSVEFAMSPASAVTSFSFSSNLTLTVDFFKSK